MCNRCQMSQIYILLDVNINLISNVYKIWPDLLHHFSGQPLSTSFLQKSTFFYILVIKMGIFHFLVRVIAY